MASRGAGAAARADAGDRLREQLGIRRHPEVCCWVSAGLEETGLVEGRDFAIEYHSTGDQIKRLPAIVADVVARRVTVILVVSDTYALAVKAATTAIPIVYIGGNDPVRIGLVASLNRPGGNVTGVTVLNVEIAAKRLQLLHELMPTTQAIEPLTLSGHSKFRNRLQKLGRRCPSSWLGSSYPARQATPPRLVWRWRTLLSAD